MMLVGNKCDLEEKREVSSSEGQEFAKQSGSQFKETSAKTRVNVEESFYDLVRMIRELDPSRVEGGGGGEEESEEGGVCCVVRREGSWELIERDI